MSTAVALVSIAVFVIAFRLIRIASVASETVLRTRVAVSVLSDRTRSEDEKERAAREAAVVLLGRFFLITGLTALALAPSLLSIVVAIWLGIADAPGVMDAFLSPWVIAAACALFVVDYVVRR